jgi:hypothetical protein
VLVVSRGIIKTPVSSHRRGADDWCYLSWARHHHARLRIANSLANCSDNDWITAADFHQRACAIWEQEGRSEGGSSKTAWDRLDAHCRGIRITLIE